MEVKEILELVEDNTFEIDTAIKLLGSFSSEDTITITNLLNKLQSNTMSLDRVINLVDTIKQANIEPTNINKGSAKKKKNSKSKGNQTSRPLEQDEFDQIIKLCMNGFNYTDKNGNSHTFYKKPHIALALLLQRNIGLRISDILLLKPSNFKDDKLAIKEKKTGKYQYRDISPTISNLVLAYALENGIKNNDFLFTIKRRAIHAQIEIIRDYLGLDRVSSHSFRKLFGTTAYDQTKDIQLVKELYNHSSIATTQKYLRVKQSDIDEISKKFEYTSSWN